MPRTLRARELLKKLEKEGCRGDLIEEAALGILVALRQLRPGQTLRFGRLEDGDWWAKLGIMPTIQGPYDGTSSPDPDTAAEVEMLKNQRS